MRTSITMKLLALVGVAVVALAVSATAGLLALRWLAATGQGLYDHGVAGLSAISDIAVAVEAQSALVGRAPAELNAEAVTKYRSEFRKRAAEVDERVATLQRAGLDAKRRRLLDDLVAAEGAYRAQADKVFGFASSLAQEQAVQVLQGDFAAAERNVKQALGRLVEETQALAKADAGNMQTSARTTGSLLLLCAAVLGTVVVVSSVAIARSITRPLKQTVAVLGAVAQGDFCQTLDVRSGDEIGQMADALNTAVAAIGDALIAVNRAAGSVTSGARQVSSASEQLSAGAQEQASSLEQTAASLEELAETAKQNSESARQASELSSAARDVADTGGTVVNQAVQAMTEIKQASKKIGDITTLIDEIAFQTNLLALNAAVEAARAGEQGRGFAVVAAEVRNLAQRAADAAREIAELIRDSVSKVEAGSALVSRSGETLTEIVRSVKRVADIVGEIAGASQEQTNGIRQVNQAVATMDGVVQSNAAQTEELSSTAQSLASEAMDLQQLVGRFRIGRMNGRRRDTDETIRPVSPAPALIAVPDAEPTEAVLTT